MVTQKLISLKLDINQLEQLDKTCRSLGINRNKFINFLVYYGNFMMKDSKNMALLSSYQSALSAFDD